MELVYKHLRYFKYVLKHKWYVFLECCKMGMPWRGLIHDWSKFTWVEWLPYVNTFGVKKKSPRDKSGAYDPSKVSPEFNVAWNHHVHANCHHWQYYILLGDVKKIPVGCGVIVEDRYVKDAVNMYEFEPAYKVLPMPLKYIKEMVCDWRGAGRAQGTKGPINWYSKNHSKMILHPESRKIVEYLLIKDRIIRGGCFIGMLELVDKRSEGKSEVSKILVGDLVWEAFVEWVKEKFESVRLQQYDARWMGMLPGGLFNTDIVRDDRQHRSIIPVDSRGNVVWDVFEALNE